ITKACLSLNMDVADIISAIDLELRSTPSYIKLTVGSRKRIGTYWQIAYETRDNVGSTIDESYEGSAVWWKVNDKQTATADVLSVSPEEGAINLRYATAPPPDKGEELRLYPPRYLDALKELWEGEWCEVAEEWYDVASENNWFDA